MVFFLRSSRDQRARMLPIAVVLTALPMAAQDRSQVADSNWTPPPTYVLPDEARTRGLEARAFVPLALADVGARSPDQAIEVSELGRGANHARVVRLSAGQCVERLNLVERNLASAGYSLRSEDKSGVPLYSFEKRPFSPRLVKAPKFTGLTADEISRVHHTECADAGRLTVLRRTEFAGKAAKATSIPFEFERGNHEFVQCYVRGRLDADFAGNAPRVATDVRLGGCFFGKCRDLIVVTTNATAPQGGKLVGTIEASALGKKLVSTTFSDDKPYEQKESFDLGKHEFFAGSIHVPVIDTSLAFKLEQKASADLVLAVRPAAVDVRVDTNLKSTLFAQLDLASFLGLGKVFLRFDGDLLSGRVGTGASAGLRGRPGSGQVVLTSKRFADGDVFTLGGALKLKAKFDIFFGLLDKEVTLLKVFEFKKIRVAGFMASDVSERPVGKVAEVKDEQKQRAQPNQRRAETKPGPKSNGKPARKPDAKRGAKS